jgi:SAM-dependent methyltransferase/uncharacterized protein YbaR (Trm112 family)
MFRNFLVCPDCHNGLADNDQVLRCLNCKTEFPIIRDIPVLLPSRSVFSIEQVASVKQTYYAEKVVENSLKSRVRKSLPKLTGDRSKLAIDQRVKSLIDSLPTPIKGLQIGAGENPGRIGEMFPNVQWMHSDVDLSYAPHIIADVTGLPVADGCFDVVYADQVLEHVIDINQAAKEIQRVLRVGGLLVIGIPFLYPFHGVPYDFYRVTPCGIRVMFDQTESIHISSGSGAWSALALQMEARLVNIFKQRQARMVASAISRFLFFGLKYVDAISNEKRNMISCASLTYIGRKVSRRFTPQEMMTELRGTIM